MKLKVVFLVLLMAACSKKATPADAGVSESAALQARMACTFKAGALASETLSSDSPTGKNIPIEHIVYVMQENHSFDNYFSKLAGVQAAADSFTNPSADGGTVARFHQPQLCTGDPDHSWKGSHQDWDNGLNDGFVTTNGAYSMGYWDSSDIPFYYGLASAFATSDQHFCSVLGPTDPNRMFAMGATTYGITFNTYTPENDPAGNPYPNLFLELNSAKVPWKYYVDAAPPEFAIFITTYLNNAQNYDSVAQFMTDAAAGTLPPFSIVETNETNYGDSPDEHPPGDIQLGQNFVQSVYQAVTTSPQWPSTALFYMYDEGGGYYDSVPPPAACPPDDIPIQLQPGDPPGVFDRFGFRVPLVVVSPYAKRGYVSHIVSDHTSVLRFVEAKFDLPAMTARDANADALMDMFDFTSPDTSVPTLPSAVIDPTGLSYCEATFGSSN